MPIGRRLISNRSASSKGFRAPDKTEPCIKQQDPLSESHNERKEIIEPATPFLLPPLGGETTENRDRVKVTLTHFISPGEFYVHDATAQMTYQSIKSKLSVLHNKEPAAKTFDQLQVSKLCVLKLDDTSFERCKILKLGPSEDEPVELQLIDTGCIKTVLRTNLFEIDTELSELPPLGKLCHVWGLRPAGHYTQWPKASIEEALTLFKSATAYVKEYHSEKNEKSESTIHYVRLYFEQVKLGGALECDHYVTICFNDLLFQTALAIRVLMPVTVQPSKGWPAKREIPDEFVAIPRSFDDYGLVYLNPTGPYDHKEAISELLNWYYPKQKPGEQLNHWMVGEACVIKGLFSNSKKLEKDEPDFACYFRATVRVANNEAKEATVFLIDYAVTLEKLKYEKMYKELVAFEYAPQAWHCELLKFQHPGNTPVDKVELAGLDHVLCHRECFVSVKERREVPLVDIILPANHEFDMAEVHSIIRPTESVVLDTPSAAPTPDESDTFRAAFSFGPTNQAISEPKKPTTRRVNPLFLATDSEPTENGPPRGRRNRNPLYKPESLPEEHDDCVSVIQSAKADSSSLEDKVVIEEDPMKTLMPDSPSSSGRLLTKSTVDSESNANAHVDVNSPSSSEADAEELQDFEADRSPQFHFDDDKSAKGFKAIRRLSVPLRKLVPVRLLKIKESYIWLQPTRHEFNEGPVDWENQYDGFLRFHSELQRVAKHFPVLEDLKLGLCCVFLNPIDSKWHRGVIRSVFEKTVTVYLVDDMKTVEAPKENVRKLPTEYMNVPEHKIRCQLVGGRYDLNRSKPSFPVLRSFISKGKSFYGLIKVDNDPGETKRYSVKLRYEDEYGNLISPVDGIY